MPFTFNPFTGNFDQIVDVEGIIPKVDTRADLPDPTTSTDRTYEVRNNTGVWPYSLGLGTQKGFYRSNGTIWEKVELSAEIIQQNIDTASSADRARANHTGTQPISTVDGLQPALDGKAPVSHTHVEADITDLDKYTQAEADALLLQKANVVHTHVEADITDLDKYTQAAVDALLAGKAATIHTHVEADITDLDKYTQAEVDLLLEPKVQLDLTGPNLYVAPDAGSAQPGDFIGSTGIRDAIREASRYMIQNPTSFINIYLRDGEYTLSQPIEIAHPQGKKVIRLRPLTLQNLATNQAIDSALVMNDQVADDATLAANYSVIINCPSYAMFFDKGTGIETVDSIMFRYTGTSTSRAGVYCAQQGSASIQRCAFIGFPYGVRALEFSSVGVVTGGFFIYCTLTALRAEEMSVIRVTQSANYKTTFHSETSYTIYALTKAYIRVVAASTSRMKVYNDSTNRAAFLLTGMATMACTRCDVIGGDEGWSVQQGSFAQISSCSVRGNTSYAVFVTGSDATVTSLDADPTGTSIQQRIYALRGSNINETGTHPNVNFVPTIGSVADSSAID